MARVGVANNSIDKLDVEGTITLSDKMVLSKGEPQIPEKSVSLQALTDFIDSVLRKSVIKRNVTEGFTVFENETFLQRDTVMSANTEIFLECDGELLLL